MDNNFSSPEIYKKDQSIIEKTLGSVKELLTKQAEEKIKEYESVVPVYEFADYLVDENMRGINFGPGSWHAVSQDLPKSYYITPMGVSTPAVYSKYHYTYSPNSTMWVAKGPHIDIDTEEEMKIAQILYREKLTERN